MGRTDDAWRHEIRISLRSASVLTKADSALLIEIRDEGELQGHLEVGRGSVIWWGRNKQSGKRVPWARFIQALEDTPGRTVRSSRRQSWIRS
jgi:hypothetical protein